MIVFNPENRTFESDFFRFYNKLKTGENFCFSRFSDGEIYILKNQTLELSDKGTFCNGKAFDVVYPVRDRKQFDPNKDFKTKELLTQSFLYSAPGYYKGLTCRCCGGDELFDWQVSQLEKDQERLTWANLWINGNYKHFINLFVPLLTYKNIIVIAHKDADFSKFPGKVIKHFPVGENCIVNDLHLIDEIKEYIRVNKIENYVFLFAASSLSNILCYELYKDFPNNTYIDIGTAMHPYFGFELQRAYLLSYWYNVPTEFGSKICVW